MIEGQYSRDEMNELQQFMLNHLFLEEGNIDGSVNIPLGQTRHGDIDDLKGKKIITYCNSGYRGNIGSR